MARWRVYVKPFDVAGNYVSDYIEVTSDVASLGNPKQGIDNTEFDVGVIKNSGFNITLRNDHGHYSDVTELQSIFSSTRKNSLIKITWDIRDYDLICGFFQCGREPLGGEYVVFEGLINEVTSTSDINQQQATFAVLGFESLLDEIEVPYSSISNGDLFSVVLYTMLNQAPFNERVTVSQANITPSTDLAIDDKASLENKSVGQTLKDLLLASNSVLFIKSGVVYVSGRTAAASVVKTFYGQASGSIENIIAIPKYRDGMNRVFNHWTWEDTTVVSRDLTSLDTYGMRPKSIKLDVIADASTSKIQTILDANKTEFAFPKVELELETPIWYDTLALEILNRVNIDYPTINIPFEGSVLPRYDLGTSIYDGTVKYPHDQWSLTIGTSTNFKIMSRRLDIKKHTVIFALREI
jgi:hypothetical protein